MSTRPVSVTIDEQLYAYAQGEVEAGRAKSVSAVVNAALARRAEADRAADAAVLAAVEAVLEDPDASARMERMTAHLLSQREQAERQAAGD
ncbi:type II toxin-antitoxin system ParD family antitoxin [Planotetraspora sp. GP83]|uniref:type II toxin-antitoxin system ParD family antitoxin n=1 Tax=Planotetraspora sp. GP83 TaxID=3156264 RepID=UPI0035185A07